MLDEFITHIVRWYKTLYQVSPIVLTNCKFANDLRQVGGFLRFPLTIKLTIIINTHYIHSVFAV
jgi:hypothetical protein